MAAENWATLPGKLDYSHGKRPQHVNYAQFVARHTGANLRFMEGVGWYRWTGKVWESTGDEGAAYQAVSEAAKILYRYAADKGSEIQWVTSAVQLMLNNRERRAIVAEMQHLRELRVSADDFDCARHLLTFQNGTVDLRSGELHPHNPDDRITMIANVDYVPDAPCPRWERFVCEVFPAEPELQSYFQAFLGYAISGEVREHALGVWYGAHGRNGKGTTIRTLQAIFGAQMVREIPFQTFELSRGNQVHTELTASLRDARIVVAQEGNEGVSMDVARLKNWTGGDRISARHLYGREFTFDPKFTIILATNHLPQFSAGGAALWARTKAILFGQSFADRRDPDLEPTIQGPEREGIAAWIVRGAVRYYREGLADPLAVLSATEFHKDSVDPLKELIGELFDYCEGAKTLRANFNAELKEWREINGDRSSKFSPSSVKRHLVDSGKVREVRPKGEGWCYEGIRLMSDPEPVSGRGVFDMSADSAG